MEEEKSSVKKVMSYLKEYAEERLRLSTLIVYDKTSRMFSGIVSSLVKWVLLTFMVLFLSIGLAWWLGQASGNVFLGFIIMGIVYGLAAVLIYTNREKWIREPFVNSFLKDISHEEN